MIKFIIARGIGFAPGSVSYIPTLGFSIGEVIGPWHAQSGVSDTWLPQSTVTDTYKEVAAVSGGWKGMGSA